jgi:hypothetical protein
MFLTMCTCSYLKKISVGSKNICCPVKLDMDYAFEVDRSIEKPCFLATDNSIEASAGEGIQYKGSYTLSTTPLGIKSVNGPVALCAWIIIYLSTWNSKIKFIDWNWLYLQMSCLPKKWLKLVRVYKKKKKKIHFVCGKYAKNMKSFWRKSEFG